jgi:hypothetical protein
VAAHDGLDLARRLQVLGVRHTFLSLGVLGVWLFWFGVFFLGETGGGKQQTAHTRAEIERARAPWLMIVLSSATTGAPSRSARCTSGAIFSGSGADAAGAQHAAPPPPLQHPPPPALAPLQQAAGCGRRIIMREGGVFEERFSCGRRAPKTHTRISAAKEKRTFAMPPPPPPPPPQHAVLLRDRQAWRLLCSVSADPATTDVSWRASVARRCRAMLSLLMFASLRWPRV